MKVSGSELARLTGMAWRTIRARMDAAGITGTKNGAATEFESAEALRAIYLPTGNEQLDGNHERARKDKELADKLSLENKVRRKELIPLDVVIHGVGGLIANANSKLRQIPHAIGQHVPADIRPRVVGESAKLVGEALGDLASGAEDVLEGTPDTDSEPVGGHESTPLNGGERGTWPVEDE